MPENILLTDLLHGGTNSLRTEITNTPVVTNTNLDIALSVLRDAITKTGETVKTLADVVDKLSDVGITSLPSLIAGSDIVGKVGIDQTTPGTTNAVVNKNTSGNEIFTDANPGSIKLTGSNAGASEVLTVNNTVGGVGFTGAKITGQTKAFVTVETAQIRFTLDGTAPTTAVGHLLEIGDILKLDSTADLASFRAIRTGAVSASLQCTYSV